MARSMPLGRLAVRSGFVSGRGAAVCSLALLGTLSLIGQTPAARSFTDGVYSPAQAVRGQQLYKAQCAGCHGNALEGTSGPPLAGDGFLGNWSAQAMANL